MVKVTREPLVPARVCGELPVPAGSGSILVHFAVVKAEAGDRATAGIHFEPENDIEAEMAAIEVELRSRWKLDVVLLVRRMGRLAVGEVISVAAVAAAGREEAFDACHQAISMFKKMKAVRKQELFVDTSTDTSGTRRGPISNPSGKPGKE